MLKIHYDIKYLHVRKLSKTVLSMCIEMCMLFFFVHPSLCTSFKQIDFDIESTLSIQKIPIDNTIANILLVPFNHEKCSNPKEKMQEENEYK